MLFFAILLKKSPFYAIFTLFYIHIFFQKE